MEIKVFSDAVDALEKLGKKIVAIKDIPKDQRDRQIKAVTEAFTLLDSTLLLVINRLGDIVQIEDEKMFWKELGKVSDSKDWMEIERDVRLCRNLRTAGKELKNVYWRCLSAFGSSDAQH